MQVPSTVAPLGQPQAGFNPSQILVHTSVTPVPLVGGSIIANLPENPLPASAAVPATYQALDALAIENFGRHSIVWMPIAQGAAIPRAWAGPTAACPGGLQVAPDTASLYVPGLTMGDPVAVIIWGSAPGLVKVRRGYQLKLIS